MALTEMKIIVCNTDSQADGERIRLEGAGYSVTIDDAGHMSYDGKTYPTPPGSTDGHRNKFIVIGRK